MQIHQVRYFLALCEARSFTRAAQRCGVTQPSLTNAIRRLEEALGGPLFTRSRRNVQLTRLGLAVEPHARQIVRCVEQAKRAARECLAAHPADDARSAAPEESLGV